MTKTTKSVDHLFVMTPTQTKFAKYTLAMLASVVVTAGIVILRMMAGY